jgi:hypothetical protein
MHVLRKAEKKEVRRVEKEEEKIEPEVVRLLRNILDYLDTNFPRSDDEPAYASDTITVPAFSIVTITWTVVPEWEARIRHLYADVAPKCTYEWNLTGLTVKGNEITFHRAVVVKAGGKVTLVIRNEGTANQSIDVLIEGWARRVVK